MKTTSLLDNGRSRKLTLGASLVATLVVTSALVCVHPVFAQTDDNWDGGTTTESWGAPTPYRPDNSWDVPDPLSDAGPALAPAPEQPLDPQVPSFGESMTEAPRGLIEEPWIRQFPNPAQ